MVERVRLTDRSVAALKARDKRYDVSDSLRVGLRVRVTPTGIKTWIFEKRIRGGPLRSHTLGRFPAISLSEAREKAISLEKEAIEGVDRKARQTRNETVATALEAYKAIHLDNLKSGGERYRQLKAALADHSAKPISKLKRRDLQAFIDATAVHAPIHANRYKAALSAFGKFAWQRYETQENIGAGLSKAVKEKPRERVLKLDEIRAIYEAAEFLNPLWTPLVRLLILTAQRRSDIAHLRWSEIELEKQRFALPAARTKSGRAHIVHLSNAAQAALPEQSKWEFLFTTTGTSPVSGFSKMKRELDKLLPDLEPWRLHDFRTAFATEMAERGADEGVVDRILNHVASGSSASAVARVYNLSSQLPQRAKVLDDWASLVTRCEAQTVRLAV